MLSNLIVFSALVGIASSACFDNGDKEIGGGCYKFVAQKMSFADARNWCHYQNPVTSSYLAYVPNQFTANFLASYARSAFGSNDGSFWIGLSRKSGGPWTWDNGFPVTYTNFGDQLGNNYMGESIVNAKWNTFGDTDKNFFVCSYDPAAPPTFSPMSPTPSILPPTMQASTQPVPTTTGSSCTPGTPRTFLYAYSTDFNFTDIDQSFGWSPNDFYANYVWNTFANVRFDLRIPEDIVYHYDTDSYNASLLSHKPDPSLGYLDNTTGSDMFTIIRNFLKNTEYLCGSMIVMAAKRYPNEVEIDDLIAELRRNHVFVYILSSDDPSGGTNPSAMFNVSYKTNGYSTFSPDEWLNSEIFYCFIAIGYPNQFVASNFLVSGSGTANVSFQVYNGTWPENRQQIFIYIIYLNRKPDGSLKGLHYTLTDPTGNVNMDGPFIPAEGSKDNARSEYPVVNDTILYTLSINYEYQVGRQEQLQVRMYSGDYMPKTWLPFED